MKLTINNKEYTITFGTEAAYHPEAIEETARMFLDNLVKGVSIKRMISFMAAVPKATLTLFYAGLLEHHGENGDRSIRKENDAKKLLKAYFAENPDVSFADLLSELVKQIGEDDFIEKTAVFGFLKKNEEQTAEAEPEQATV